MLRSHEQTDGGEVGPRKADSPIHRGNASAALAIPWLGKNPTILETKIEPSWAKLALLWLDAGYPTKPNNRDDAHDLVKHAVNEWVTQYAGKGELIECGFVVALNREDAGYEFSRSPEGFWTLLLYCTGRWSDRYLEPVVKKLDLQCPGFGKSILHALEMISYNSLLVLTPCLARQVAENTLWFCASTQEEWIGELADMGHEPDDIDGAFSPDEFNKGLPDWVVNPFKGECLSTEALTILSHGWSKKARVAQTIMDINSLLRDHERLPSIEESEEEAQSVYYANVLRWNESDSMERLYNELMQSANNNADYSTDVMHVLDVPWEPDAFKQWKASMEKTLTGIKLLNRLIGLVTVEEINDGTN